MSLTPCDAPDKLKGTAAKYNRRCDDQHSDATTTASGCATVPSNMPEHCARWFPAAQIKRHT